MSLIHKSAKFRKRNLRACIKEVQGRIEFVVEYEGKTAKDVRQRMDDIMADHGEGLVMKQPESEYVLNGRNRDWIKVLPYFSSSRVPTERFGLFRQVKPEYMVGYLNWLWERRLKFSTRIIWARLWMCWL